MNYNLLYQCVFCLAFLNFFIYWIDLFFFSFSSNVANSLQRKKKFIKWLPISSSKKSLSQKPASIDITKFIISLTLWCSLTLLIIFRYIQSNHFPLSNFYEALIFLTWSLVTLNFLILFEPFNYKIRGSFFHIFPFTHKKTEKKDSEEVKPEKRWLTTFFLQKNSRINFFQILPLQIKNNLTPKVFEDVILILREKQEKITYISTRFFNQNNTLEKEKSIDFVLHREEEPNKIDFIQNQFQLYNFRKNHFPNYEHSRFKNVELQPIASLNVKEWQPTNQQFLNHATEFSKNLQFFILLKEIIKIPSEYYKKFGIAFLYDIFVLCTTRKAIFFPSLPFRFFSFPFSFITEEQNKERKNKTNRFFSLGSLIFLLKNLTKKKRPQADNHSLSQQNDKKYSLFSSKFENISQEKKPASQPPDFITHSLKEIKSNQFIDEQKKKEQEKKKQEKKIYGGILAPCILFILAFAQFNLSSEFTPLVPALKSNWLFMHVSIMICSYTTFIVGGLISLILLIQIFFFSRSNIFYGPKENRKYHDLKAVSRIEEKNEKPKELSINKFGVNNISTILPQELIVPKLSSFDYYNFIFPNIPNREILKKETKLKIKKNSALSNSQPSRFTNFQTTLTFQWKNKRENINCSSIKTKAWQQLQNKTKQLEFSISKEKKGGDFNITLDNLSYRMFGIGFPLFTLGLLSGAVWANSAWGSYWSWDIKEVGSFIHWLVLTFYFHCRYKNYITFSHWVGFLSLIVLFFNFFGVSLGIYGSSLHAYS